MNKDPHSNLKSVENRKHCNIFLYRSYIYHIEHRDTGGVHAGNTAKEENAVYTLKLYDELEDAQELVVAKR